MSPSPIQVPLRDVPASPPPLPPPPPQRPTRSREAKSPEAAQSLAQPRSHSEGGTERFPTEEELGGRGVPVPPRPPQRVRHRQVVQIGQRSHRRSGAGKKSGAAWERGGIWGRGDTWWEDGECGGAGT